MTFQFSPDKIRIMQQTNISESLLFWIFKTASEGSPDSSFFPNTPIPQTDRWKETEHLTVLPKSTSAKFLSNFPTYLSYKCCISRGYQVTSNLFCTATLKSLFSVFSSFKFCEETPWTYQTFLKWEQSFTWIWMSLSELLFIPCISKHTLKNWNKSVWDKVLVPNAGAF